MKNSYFDLIDHSYYFPQEGFDLKNDYLTFHGISLKHLIDKYGTPFKLMYLPRIGQQIRKARNLFNRSIKKHKYKGKYHYCYCTKCSHFSHVIKTALDENVHLETSSSFDIDLILNLLAENSIKKNCIIVHNGYKTELYLEKIIELNKLGFKNSILVLDSLSEIKRVKKCLNAYEGQIKIGIRMAIDEEPQSSYYTSRLGIRLNDILDLYNEQIKDDPQLSLKMVHFYVDSGIRDSIYYWGEFQKALNLYVELAQICPSLSALNLGGGFPIRNSLRDQFDYEGIIDEIVKKMKNACVESKIVEPDILTEFGKYTVGESGALIFSVLEQKQQNDSEKWYLVDNSLLNTIPDAGSIFEKFILLPINKWSSTYSKVIIGGISCDHSDYYNAEGPSQQVFLPNIEETEDDPLYVGFFHTGAYQDSISGYGGIKHCLIPAPRLIMIDRDEHGNLIDAVHQNDQTIEEMLSILGYLSTNK